MTNTNKLEIRQEFPTKRCKISVSAELLIKLLELPPETVIQFAEFDKNNCVTFYFANIGQYVPEGCAAPEYTHVVPVDMERVEKSIIESSKKARKFFGTGAK